ncbi:MULTISPECIES: pirin family protein [unclassified Cobetia]|uniref:pirin family protein n=1 Tax=unclassified Cobetia TaxID=2609414 RepID=UPI002096FAB1|nr:MULTISPECIES: pirin family protein [unclassified Cobetia]MCO7233510.1 pirin family protein [Cobetia sp. Dlab-2-AX]MCO7236786.1 pirin family protein [Cobetia sp. Dlab-2-U]
MLTLRPSNERGHARFAWLESRHSFSFANYYDPAHMGVSVLRVINDDHVAPGAGFDPHSHSDMEIISYVLSGNIEHRDSMGSRHTLGAGEVQLMSAGTGIEHSEYNASSLEPLRFLQIWITPQAKGLPPRYQQQPFVARDGLTLLIAPPAQAAPGVLTINQDARMYRIGLQGDDEQRAALELPLDSERRYYLHVIDGSATLKGKGQQSLPLSAGDAVTLDHEPEATLDEARGLHALLFDLPA